MLQAHPDIDSMQNVIANFTAFGPSSLDFFIYVFTRVLDRVHFHGVKQDILLKIAAIIDKHGAQIAFPRKPYMWILFPRSARSRR